MKKYATIYSNDPDKPTVKIHLATVVDPMPDTNLAFTFAPSKTSLSKESKKSKIVIENNGDSKIYIESLSPQIDGLAFKIKGNKVKPGKKSEIRFEWKGEFEKENIERSMTFLAYGDGVDSTRFTLPVLVKGTNPTPPRVAKSRKGSTKARSRKKSAVRKPTTGTKASSSKTEMVKTKPSSIEKQTLETKKVTDDKSATDLKEKATLGKEAETAKKTTTESKDNQ